MARRKKPENESKEQIAIRQQLEQIANAANRSEKVAWERKRNSLTAIVEDRIRPIEDRILDLETQKQPLLDEMNELRSEMVQLCIHPYDYLLHKGDHIECKFCNRKISVTNNG